MSLQCSAELVSGSMKPIRPEVFCSELQGAVRPSEVITDVERSLCRSNRWLAMLGPKIFRDPALRYSAVFYRFSVLLRFKKTLTMLSMSAYTVSGRGLGGSNIWIFRDQIKVD